MYDNEYFCIHDDLFDRIKLTRQDRNILWRFISNKPNEDEYHSKATEIHNDKIQNKKRIANKYSTKHNPQRKRQKQVDYRKNSFYYFMGIIIYPHPKLDSDESEFFSNRYGQSMKNQLNEVISKKVLTNLLKLWDEKKTQSHPS